MKLNLPLPIFLILFISLACTYEEPEANKYIGEPVKITAEELTKAYDNNIVGANSKYKDKLLLVTGKLSFIDERNGILGDDGFGIVFENDSSVKIIARVLKSEKDKVADLNKGQEVSLLCFGNAMTNENIISIKDCKVK